MFKKKPQKTIFILLVILGFLIVMQYKIAQTGMKYVSFRDIETLTNRIDSQNFENQKLKDKINSLNDQIINYESAIEETGNIESVLIEDIEIYGKISGVEALSGPGVVIIFTDSERQLLDDENPNNLLVHDLDIQALIDDLVSAGAEAIAVNGQRVIPHFTEIVCNGPTIRINDELYSQPFIIEAIGNRTYLEAAVNAPDKYGYILKQWGLFLEVNTSIYLEIPGFEGYRDFEYMKTKEN
ncbi:MAG: DUF881 domain-containing protein [Clostridiales bacterium]|nr:DUF881 domain-containing protein [Clostridiales bacterium]